MLRRIQSERPWRSQPACHHASHSSTCRNHRSQSSRSSLVWKLLIGLFPQHRWLKYSCPTDRLREPFLCLLDDALPPGGVQLPTQLSTTLAILDNPTSRTVDHRESVYSRKAISRVRLVACIVDIGLQLETGRRTSSPRIGTSISQGAKPASCRTLRSRRRTKQASRPYDWVVAIRRSYW